MKKLILISLTCGLVCLPWSTSVLAKEADPAKQAQKEAKAEAKRAEQEAKAAAKQAKQEAKQAAKEAKSAAKEAAKAEKEQAKSAKQAEKEAEKAQAEAEKQARREADLAEKEARRAAAQQPKLTREQILFLQSEERLASQVAELNTLAEDADVKEEILQSIRREHGISIKRFNAQLESHPNLGVGDLLVANLITRHVRHTLNEVIALNQEGQSWAQIAQEHRLALPSLIEGTYKVGIVARATIHADPQS